MEFNIKNTEVYGLEKAVIASGNAMRTEIADNMETPTEKDMNRAEKLGSTNVGEGHDQYLSGVIVQFDLYAPLYMWKQIQRYHFMDFISSQSTMHKLTKFDVKSQCVVDTDRMILDRYQQLLDYYNSCPNDTPELSEAKDRCWRTLVASLPCGFVLGATMTTNYRQLKTIYYQRRNHKLKEWHEFCDWCLTLPRFKELCLKKENNYEKINFKKCKS